MSSENAQSSHLLSKDSIFYRPHLHLSPIMILLSYIFPKGGINVKQGTVKRNAGSIFPYQGWPTVCKGFDGTLYAVCSGHRLEHVCPFGKNLMYRSCDGGETWSDPQIINDTYLDDRDAGITAIDENNLIMSYFNHPLSFYLDFCESDVKNNADYPGRELAMGMMSYCRTLPAEKFVYGSFIRRSSDKGLSWAPAEKVPVTAPHGPIVLKSGELFYLGKEFHSGTLEKGEIYACKYTDGEWKPVGKVNLPDNLNPGQVHEPSVLELPDGELLGALRVHGNTDEDRFTMYLCRSRDGGRTWSEPSPTGISGSPPHLMLHSSGAVVLSYARREKPYSERAVISRDGGKTFGKEIILRYSKTSDLGYPSTVELDDGSLLTVYYHYEDSDDFASILYTKWSLDEE